MVQTAACDNNELASCATGVTGVDILGTMYDVIFSQASFYDLFASVDPAFLGDVDGADAALGVLATALNSAGISGLIGDPTSKDPSYLIVPFVDGPPSVATGRVIFYVDGNDFSGSPLTIPLYAYSFSDFNPEFYDVYAVFTPSAVDVPAPPVLMLFGLGLFGMSLSRRRRIKGAQCL
jgi:hypothetical protein